MPDFNHKHLANTKMLNQMNEYTSVTTGLEKVMSQEDLNVLNNFIKKLNHEKYTLQHLKSSRSMYDLR